MARARTDAAAVLQGVPPPEFVRARNALAARLAKEGKADEAKRIKRLRRPSPVVWALNRAGSSRPRALGALFDAVDELRRAQLGQGDLRGSTERYRAAFEPIVDAASHLLGEAGTRRAPDLDRRLRSTLLAAAADRGIRGKLRTGRLAEEYAGPGFAALTDDAIPAGFLRRRPMSVTKRRADLQAARRPRQEPRGADPTRATGGPAPGAEPQRHEPDRRAGRAREQQRARTALREARRATRRAERRALRLDKEATRQEHAAQAAERRVEALRTLLRDQERRSRELQAAATSARSAHREAQRSVPAAESVDSVPARRRRR